MRLKLAINSSKEISKHLSNIWLLWNQTLFTLALLEEHLVKQSRAWNSVKQSLAPGRDLLRLATGPSQPHSDQGSSPLDQPKDQHANLQLIQTPRASLVLIAVKIFWYFFSGGLQIIIFLEIRCLILEWLRSTAVSCVAASMEVVTLGVSIVMNTWETLKVVYFCCVKGQNVA